MSAALCTWDAITDIPIDGYNVYLRKNDIYGRANINLITPTSLPSFKLTGLSPGTYSAYCTAVKGENESDPSNIDTFIIEFGNSYLPQNLQSVITDEMAGDVSLSWDYVPGITQYKVYLKQGAGSFVDQGIVYSNGLELTGLADDDYDWYVASMYDSQEVDSDTEEFIIGTS